MADLKMSHAQAIRGEFLFFKGSAVGGTMPTEAIYVDAAGNDCSSMISCAGLKHKTVEIRGKQADFGGHAVVLEGTISEGANDKAFWFPLTAAIAGPGLVTIEIGAAAPQAIFYEPELTWLRIRATPVEIGLATFPVSIAATFAGVYEGHRWDQRVKGPLGYPAHDPDYKAV